MVYPLINIKYIITVFGSIPIFVVALLKHDKMIFEITWGEKPNTI